MKEKSVSLIKQSISFDETASLATATHYTNGYWQISVCLMSSHFKTITIGMTIYNTSEGSHVHNSACYGNYTSQPRWLPIFVRPNVGDVTNYNFSKLEIQHPKPLSQIMSANENDVETFDFKLVQRIVPDYGIKACTAQEKFCNNKWDRVQEPMMTCRLVIMHIYQLHMPGFRMVLLMLGILMANL